MEQDKIVKDFIEAEKKYRKLGKKMEKYFRESSGLNEAETLADLEQVKENLREMPYSVFKTLIFRSILIKEEELTTI